MTKNTKKDQQIKEIVTLTITSGTPVVSSLLIAEHFEKRHDNVLRDIERLELPEDFNALNFEPVNYKDKKGEIRPAVNMTRDGFTLLAMGFTGKKAMAWKLKYIEAFNAMEVELQRRLEVPTTEPRYNYLLSKPKGLRALEGLLDYWCFVEGLSYDQAMEQLMAFNRARRWEELNSLQVASSFCFILMCLKGVDKTEDRTPGTSEDLRPLYGVIDYWEHTMKGWHTDKIRKLICKECRVEGIEEIPLCDIPRVTQFAWGMFQQELGHHNAMQGRGTSHAKH